MIKLVMEILVVMVIVVVMVMVVFEIGCDLVGWEMVLVMIFSCCERKRYTND
ncbi:hypothetical protein MKX01_020637, partial [Papaver californicum]